jgi:hypothetical protein
MRFMILLEPDHSTEAGVIPGEQLLADRGKYDGERVKAGVMLAGEGLQLREREGRPGPQIAAIRT